jgi:hypothetical protein
MSKTSERRGPFTSPRLWGEVGAQRRVRGALHALLCQLYSLIDAPHPNPLPVRTGRGGVRHLRRH